MGPGNTLLSEKRGTGLCAVPTFNILSLSPSYPPPSVSGDQLFSTINTHVSTSGSVNYTYNQSLEGQSLASFQTKQKPSTVWDPSTKARGRRWMDRAPTPPPLQKREPDSASPRRPIPASRTQGPTLHARAPLEARGPKGRAFLAAPAVTPGLRARAAAMGHTHPRGPRSRSRGEAAVPTLRLATSPPRLPPQPSVQTAPGCRGAARAGRGRCAKGQRVDFPAAREKGAECPPREGRGGPPRRRACGRGWGRGGLPVSLAAARAATHPAPPDERYHWQQEEDGGRCRRRGGGGGGGGPVGAAERGYAQDVGVAATASFSLSGPRGCC